MNWVAAAMAGALLLAACGSEDPWPAPLGDPLAPPGFPAGAVSALAPLDNALTEERAQLGKRLFFEPKLSRTGKVSCGTCHRQENAFAEPAAVSTGVDGRTGKRNAPALVNLAWNESFFWDGRAATLEEQAGQPIEDPSEMDLPIGEAARRLAADTSYAQAFARAYGGPPTEETLRKAIASFVRVLVSANSPYDRFLRGDTTALAPAARRGLELFLDERTACFHCHPAGALTNDGFFNNGTFVEGGDAGRKAVTGRTADLGKFKVPGLRNIAVTAPYMHDGSVATLEQVVEHYARGGRGHPSTDPQIEPLNLATEEKADLVAFLHALTDDTFARDRRFGK